jgi:dimethylaniline monooxygenase (N-oxide forming)
MHDDQCETLEFDLLVVASGLFAKPYMPNLRGHERFGGLIVHAYSIKSREQLAGKRIAVIGGGKCAADMAVLAGLFGQLGYVIFRQAHWMIPRTSMGGYFPLRYTFTRFLCVPPTPFPNAPHSYLFHFLHRTFPYIFAKAMDSMCNDTIATLGSDLFNDKIFLPRHHCTNVVNGSVIPNDFIRLKRESRIIGKLATIHEIVNESTIRLDSGEELQVDMIVCATGFTEGFPFLSSTHAQTMGVPTGMTGSATEFKLYRRVVPVGVPNVAFVGFTLCSANWMVAEAASHWISDYFLGRLELPASEKEMHDEIMTMCGFSRKMFNRNGCYTNYYWLEPIEIYLNDMGLARHRTNNWISEYFGVYQPKRLRGLHEERKAKAEGRLMNRRWYFGFGHTFLVIFLLSLLYNFCLMP